MKPFLGLLPSWDIPSALAHHHLERVEGQKSIDFDWIISNGYTYSLFLFFVSFQSILKYETAFPLKFSFFTYLQVRQFCYPNMASLPTAYSICAGILFCNMSQSKMSIQSKAMLLFLVERWAFDWSGDLTLICGPI